MPTPILCPTSPNAVQSPIECGLSQAAQLLSTVILQSSPSGYWPLDETEGVTALDLSGNNNDGTYSGGYVLGVAPITANSSASVSLDGNDGHIQMPVAPELHILGDLTLEFWVDVRTLVGSSIYIDHGGSGETEIQNFIYRLNDGLGTTATFWEYTGAANESADFGVPIGASGPTFHVVCRRNATSKSMELIVDNVVVATTSYTNNPTGGELGFLRVGGRGSDHVDGRMAHVAVYDRLLSDSEVLTHYEASTL